MTTPDNKNKWNDRLKTADNAFISDLLHNTGLTGGPSLKDLPWLALTGLGAAGVGSKIKELRERKKEEHPKDIGLNFDVKGVDKFTEDTSKMREILNQMKTDNKPVRNHPSVPGFVPDARSPYGVFDYESNGYSGGPPPPSISDISEHPKFNSVDQGRSQKGRPFDRDEE